MFRTNSASRASEIGQRVGAILAAAVPSLVAESQRSGWRMVLISSDVN